MVEVSFKNVPTGKITPGVTCLVPGIGVVPKYNVQMGPLAIHVVLAQAMRYGHKLYLVFDRQPLGYPLVMENFCQCQHKISDPLVNLDLFIQSCTGQAKCSIK